MAQRESPTTVLTLRAVLDSVRSGHPLVRAAEARLRAARGSRTTAGALGNPFLSYQVDNTPFPVGSPISGLDREAMTTATLPLEPLYLRGARTLRADAEVRAAQADVSAVRQRVALDAARAYYRVALANVGVATARDLAAWLDSVVTYNRARVTEGVTAEADLIRSELERDRAAADATMLEAELAQARADVGVFVSDPGRTRLQVEVRLDDAPLPLDSAFRPTAVSASTEPGGILEQSLLVRPDVRAARERFSAASAGVVAEQRSIIRQVGATIGAKQMAGSTSMIVGLSLPVPLFDVNRGEVQRATAVRDAAGFEVMNQERMAAADIAGALQAARLLTERMTIMSQRDPRSFLARAEEGRRIALGAYREGAVPLLQVIDAGRAWGDSRLAFYRTLYAQHLSVLTLLVAQGQDLFLSLPTSAVPAPPTR